jgi:hypothetical protein
MKFFFKQVSQVSVLLILSEIVTLHISFSIILNILLSTYSSRPLSYICARRNKIGKVYSNLEYL